MPNIDIGIHLTLTSEWTNVKWRPLTYAPSLVDEHGYFYPRIWKNDDLPGMALQEHPFSAGEIEQEVRAQIEMAKGDLKNVTHLSGHMGCMGINDETKEMFKRLAVEYKLDIFLDDFQVKRFPYTGHKHLAGDARVKLFVNALEQLTPGDWLFVEHPAEESSEQAAIHHPGYENVAQDRQAVLDLLTDPLVKLTIEKLGIILISYADLAK